MGWAHGIDTSRKEGDQDIGYSIGAVCDQTECDVKIDRGLSYVCGGDPYGGEYGCGGFFCSEHLSYECTEKDEVSPQLCNACSKIWLEGKQPPPTPNPEQVEGKEE